MSIADEYAAFVDAVSVRDNSARWDALVAARQQLKHCDDDDWNWLVTSLGHPERKWFVAFIFDRESLPRRLLAPMVRAAVHERNASANRSFIDPCLRTFGLNRVQPLVDAFLDSDDDSEVAGATKLQYWCREPRERRGSW